MKRLSLFVSCLAACAALAILAPAQAHAQASVPVSISMTLPGGSSNIATNTTPVASLAYSNVYTTGYTASGRSSLKPIAYEYAVAGTLSTAGTISLRRSAGGPVYATVTVATNALSSVSFETNTWYWLRGDQIHATGSFTNPATFKPICNEF